VLGLQILALTAESLHDLPRALHCWSAAAELARRTGFPSDECQALRGRANVELMLGRVAAALGDIERALQLVEDQGLPNTAATTMAVAARVMAWQGNSQGADSALARSRELSGSSPLALVTADQAWAAGVIALTEQRFIDALTELAHVCDHPTAALWAVADLTEAAVRAGRPGSAAAALDAAERANTRLGSDHLALLILRSRALLDDGPRAEEHFRAAIDIATAVDAPLEIGRTQLLYGEWLRRHRKPLVAREHLSGALSALESAGAHAQASRAAAELRAAGIVPNRRMPQTRTKEGSALTPQELQIARLAARGLTNKQIADQVYLSHRTVSTHLYRVYPKLGITGRQQLRDALTSLETGDLSPERRAS
jgi:DNA-binding CsgD family transcriptional regulator